MRPLLLRMRGFRSYRTEATFDFRGRSLIGVVGPTGAGKSTLLDAIAFALYGRTPGEGQSPRRLLHATSESAHVELWFESDGEILQVARSIRQRGQGTQVLASFEAVEGEKIETIATAVSEIGSAVEERLGLDFEAFKRSVLLAQNQFAELLTASPSEAEKVLSGLFGFGEIEQMRTLASNRLADLRGELIAAERARESLAEATAKLVIAERELAEATARTEVFDEISEPFESAAQRLDALAVEATGLEAERVRLARLELPVPDAVAAAVDAAATRAERLAATEERRREVAASLEAASEARAAAVDAGLDTRSASILQRRSTLEAHRRVVAEAEAALAEATTAVAATADAAAAADAALAEAGEAVAAAESAEGSARAELDALRLAHTAHTLAGALSVGEPCPVCARTVDALPARERLGVIEDAETILDEAVGALRAARAARDAAAQHHSAATAARDLAAHRSEDAERRLAEAVDRCDALAAEIAADEAALAELLDAVDGDVVEVARARWEETEAAWQQATTLMGGLRDELERLRGEADTLTPLVPVIHTVASHLDFDIPPTDSPEAVATAVDALRGEIARRLGAIETRSRELAEERSGLLAEQVVLLEKVGLTDPAAHPAARAAADVEQARASGLVEERSARVATQEAAVAAAEGVAAEAARLERLVKHLASSGFPQYLLDERRRELAATASDRFRQLSGDRYGIALVDEEIAEQFGLGRGEINRFAIRDHALGGRVRSAGTLSGGETFLASLALALGLATLVAADGGALDAFFVDEGFGSLDADSLDLAMEGIERLVAERPDRLVVVVSHVPEMRERIPDLIVLGRLPGDGGTEVVRA